MNRKQRREMERKLGKDNSQKLTEKIFQFDKLPDECLACQAPFDKNSKEMAKTWNIVIPNEDTVRLYCPACWDMAVKVAEHYREQRSDNDS
tara:strand:- start:1334 stop:1606 length:273 start_codon:yes stop_codon:yes gene_type:complete